MNFTEFNLGDNVLEAVHSMGFETATPIQEQAIPVILNGSDIVGCAQTGTGKTAAFVIPLLEKMAKNRDGRIQCIILAPTRELAQQIDQQIMGLGYFTDTSSIAVYGGNQPMLFDQQKAAITGGADIIVATPGRLIQHMNLGYVGLDGVNTLILDEADRMLDMGFYEDIMKIITKLPKDRQTLMFSATMPSAIRKLASTILNNPEEVSVAISKPAEGINQTAYLVFDNNKIPLLQYLLHGREVQSMIIFASRKSSVDDITRTLKRLKYSVESMHSGKDQEERNETMRQFKAGNFRIIVATDILSRGIDIDGLSHVLNFDIPDDAADYVHRIGRTARADKTGEAISFINIDDQGSWAGIERLLEREIPKQATPSEIGKSPNYSPFQNKKGGRQRKGGSKNRGKGGKNRHKHRRKPKQ